MRQRILSLWVVFLILVILQNLSRAQEKGKFGTTIKAQYVPHIGISYGISDKIQMRLSTYLDLDGGDLFYSNLSSLCLLLELSSDVRHCQLI